MDNENVHHSFDMQNFTLWGYFTLFPSIIRMHYSSGQITLRSEESKQIISSFYSNHGIVEFYIFLKLYIILQKERSNYDFTEVLGFMPILLHKILYKEGPA